MAVEFKAKTAGFLAENEACDFLQKQGLKLLEKNYTCPCGEIDLIMQDKDTVVFIEVRLRTQTNFGNAIESVHFYKQKKLARTATLFLQKKRMLHKVNARFDIVGISQNKKIQWLKNAFSPEPT